MCCACDLCPVKFLQHLYGDVLGSPSVAFHHAQLLDRGHKPVVHEIEAPLQVSYDLPPPTPSTENQSDNYFQTASASSTVSNTTPSSSHSNQLPTRLEANHPQPQLSNSLRQPLPSQLAQTDLMSGKFYCYK